MTPQPRRLVGRQTVFEGFPEQIRLLIALSGDERATLRRMLPGPRYRIDTASALDEAARILRDRTIGIVVSPRRFSERHSWRDLLREAGRRSPPPRLIVTDRLADEPLWAEVLNLGGYDVLPQPFDSQEVARAIASAWRSWQNGQSMCDAALPDSAPKRMTQIRTCENSALTKGTIARPTSI
jgi:DNA-binding response OmpR family regulator